MLTSIAFFFADDIMQAAMINAYQKSKKGKLGEVKPSIFASPKSKKSKLGESRPSSFASHPIASSLLSQ